MKVGVNVGSRNICPGAGVDVVGSMPWVGVGGGVAVAYVAVAIGIGDGSVLIVRMMGSSYGNVGVAYVPQSGEVDAPQAVWTSPMRAMK